MMGIAELVLSTVEGLHPSYVGIIDQQAAGY
jgi:flagellar biosynthesis/type III secretory pathway M-ring protein FliF/YscJ